MGHVSSPSQISHFRLSTNSERVFSFGYLSLMYCFHLNEKDERTPQAKPISDYIEKESFEHGGSTSAVAPAARLDESGRL